jgi:hypothetical protein
MDAEQEPPDVAVLYNVSQPTSVSIVGCVHFRGRYTLEGRLVDI